MQPNGVSLVEISCTQRTPGCANGNKPKKSGSQPVKDNVENMVIPEKAGVGSWLHRNDGTLCTEPSCQRMVELHLPLGRMPSGPLLRPLEQATRYERETWVGGYLAPAACNSVRRFGFEVPCVGANRVILSLSRCGTTFCQHIPRFYTAVQPLLSLVNPHCKQNKILDTM
jgi:hypothetical protein